MTISEIVIRPARPEDAPRLHELHTASVRALCSGHYPVAIIDAWLGHRAPSGYLDAIARGGVFVAELFIAERDGRVVGFGEGVPGTVVAVYVDPENVLHGVGTVILRHAVTLARRGHAGPVRLEATLNARDFYERAGFREIRSSVQRRGVDIPMVIMELAAG